VTTETELRFGNFSFIFSFLIIFYAEPEPISMDVILL
jgi:hypothetical protein